MTGYVKEGAEAINQYIYIEPADERGIQVDLNLQNNNCLSAVQHTIESGNPFHTSCRFQLYPRAEPAQSYPDIAEPTNLFS